MITTYKTIDNSLSKIQDFEKDSWINLVNPTGGEIQLVHNKLGIDLDFLKAPLDDEEISRIEIENGHTFILVDIPTVEEDGASYVYATIPLGIILTDDYIITICLKDSVILEQFVHNKVKSFFTYKKNRFLLQLLFKISTRYLLYLKQIDKMSNKVEKQLHRSLKNKELIQLLDLEKSLVYFSTSLKGNEMVLERLLKIDAIELYPEDEDLLDNVIIENKQAIEMASIYSNILSGMMDAFASVISNNLNIVMKMLTSITIIMAIPTMFASFYGMNVMLPMQNSPYAFTVIAGLALLVATLTGFFLMKKNMF